MAAPTSLVAFEVQRELASSCLNLRIAHQGKHIARNQVQTDP